MSNGRKELIKKLNHDEVLDVIKYYTNIINIIGDNINDVPFGVDLELIRDFVDSINENVEFCFSVLKQKVGNKVEDD